MNKSEKYVRAHQNQKIRLLWAARVPLEETELAMKMLGKMSKSEWLTHRRCRNTSGLKYSSLFK